MNLAAMGLAELAIVGLTALGILSYIATGPGAFNQVCFPVQFRFFLSFCPSPVLINSQWKARNPGADHHKASDELHKIKKRNGYGGKDNVAIDTKNGGVYDPKTGEELGNVND